MIALFCLFVVGITFGLMILKRGFFKAEEKLQSQYFETGSNAQTSGNISINGRMFSGDNVIVDNGKITIDGKVVEDHGKVAQIKVEVSGDLETLKCNTCTITGSVKGDVTANTVRCGNVGGDVDANTVSCGNVAGSIDANTVKRS